MFILLLMAFSNALYNQQQEYRNLKLILPIENISKEKIREILVKRQWLILEYPLEYPSQRINFSKKDSFEMLSYLYDENKIRLSQLGYELSKLGEYEENCYSLIRYEVSEKNENTGPNKNEIKNLIEEYQFEVLLNIINDGPSNKIEIPAKYHNTINPLRPINIERLKSMGYELDSYQTGTIWFHFLIFKNDENVSK